MEFDHAQFLQREHRRTSTTSIPRDCKSASPKVLHVAPKERLPTAKAAACGLEPLASVCGRTRWEHHFAMNNCDGMDCTESGEMRDTVTNCSAIALESRTDGENKALMRFQDQKQT